ncbi:MAG TPA: hypothetical protein VMV94_11900 [Phycisphaerae bacterium]|nr:hypothetical protein [Phycisphaerae bacterium]
MRKNVGLATTAFLICALSLVSLVFAQDQAQPQQQTTAVAAEKDGTLRYQVTELTGKVRYAPIGTDPKLDVGWTQAAVGDLLGAGLQIYVPAMRARVKLTARPADPPTVILIEQGTLVGISELHLDKTQNVAKSRVKLAYGAVRAGVAEGTTRSDMEIESPVATLSKRGTDIFRFEYRNGRFMMSLSEQGRGIIQAIQTHSLEFGGLNQMRSRFVTPGQFVTQAMMRAIDNIQFDRHVNVTDSFGVQGLDQMLTLINNHGGFAFLLPPSNSPLNVVGAPPPSVVGYPQTTDTQNQQLQNQLFPSLISATPHQTGGDFGVGQGTVPGIFDIQAKAIQARKALSKTAQLSGQVRNMVRNGSAPK